MANGTDILENIGITSAPITMRVVKTGNVGTIRTTQVSVEHSSTPPGRNPDTARGTSRGIGAIQFRYSTHSPVIIEIHTADNLITIAISDIIAITATTTKNRDITRHLIALYTTGYKIPYVI
jgi:hypothetical protein